MGVNALKEIFTEMRKQKVLVYFAAAKGKPNLHPLPTPPGAAGGGHLHRTEEHLPVFAVMFSKALHPMWCSVLNNYKLRCRCGAKLIIKALVLINPNI